MGLQRFDHWAEIGAAGLAAEVVAVESCDGEYYRVADVDALLARIRAAVKAERAATDELEMQGLTSDLADYVRARDALDALLADGG